jgi:hypothetical protein
MIDSGDSGSDEQHSGDEARFGNASKEMFARKKMPPPSIPSQINNTKTQIESLLKQIEPGIEITDIDSTIQQQMTANKIDYNPNDPNLQTRLVQLTTLKEKLEEKKGGKKQKSKRYRKSRKQRKTKTKRRLRRSYKYK